MKNYQFINRKAIMAYLTEQSGMIALLYLLIMLLTEIRSLLEGEKAFELRDYQKVDRTEAHVRKAIEQLRKEKAEELRCKRHWLPVFKVLVWLGVIENKYSEGESYLRRLFPDDPTFKWLANTLSKKCSDSSQAEWYGKNLEFWLENTVNNADYRKHVSLAKRFLSFLKSN